MSFTIEPKAAPALADSGAGTSKAQEARARAIAMLSNSAPQGQGQAVPAEVRTAQAKPVQEEPVEGQVDSIEAEGASPASPSESEAVEETPPKKEEPLSSQYAVLARKEKQLRVKAQQQELAFKQREDSLRQREQEIAQKDARYQSDYIDKKRFQEDPITVMQEAGMSYDDITNRLISQQNIDPNVRSLVNELKNEIKALRGAQEDSKKSFTDQQAQSYQQAIKQIENEAKSLVSSDPAFETIKETGSVSEVVALIKKTFDEDGILLSVEEAAQAVEDELVEEAMKISRIKKIQQRLNPAAAQAPKQQGESKKNPEMKTLTNAVGTQRQLSARERAILAMEGKLNK